ncbi:MAG: hypothetical protein ACRD39_03435 [Nitrososphaeraceae archaeon]
MKGGAKLLDRHVSVGKEASAGMVDSQGFVAECIDQVIYVM